MTGHHMIDETSTEGKHPLFQHIDQPLFGMRALNYGQKRIYIHVTCIFYMPQLRFLSKLFRCRKKQDWDNKTAFEVVSFDTCVLFHRHIFRYKDDRLKCRIYGTQENPHNWSGLF